MLFCSGSGGATGTSHDDVLHGWNTQSSSQWDGFRHIRNHAALADPWKQAKIEQIALLTRAALAAHNKVALKMNVPAARIDQVVRLLPSLHAPTVSHLYDRDWLAVETVVDNDQVRDLIPHLTAAGAQGILEYQLKKIV